MPSSRLLWALAQRLARSHHNKNVILNVARVISSARQTTGSATLLGIGLFAGSVACASASTADVDNQQGSQQPGLPSPTATQPEVTSNTATAQWRVFTDMGRELSSKKQYKEAESFLLRAMDAAQRGFGPDDPHVASACNNLAELYRVTQQYEKAEPLYEEALHILAQSLGSKDVRVAFALHNIGSFYFSQHKLDKAAEYYDKALQVKLATVGPGHSETVNTLFHLSKVRWEQGRKNEAINLAKQSLDALELMRGSDAAFSRRRTQFAEMLLSEGRHDEAVQQFRRSLDHAESEQGTTGPGVGAAAENLALALQAAGKLGEAETLLMRAVDIRRQLVQQQHQQNHLPLALSLRRLAEVELALAGGRGSGRPADIAQCLLQAASAAQEACIIAEQVYNESIGLNTEYKGGSSLKQKVLGWVQPTNPLLRRTVRPDAAALELAECLRVKSAVQAASGEETDALLSVQRAHELLVENVLDGSGQSGGASLSSSFHRAVAKARQTALCKVVEQELKLTLQLLGNASSEALDLKKYYNSLDC